MNSNETKPDVPAHLHTLFAPIRRFAVAKREDTEPLHLPEELQWLTGHAHPIVLAALANSVHRTDDAVVSQGQSSEGYFIAVADEAGDELMRLTAIVGVRGAPGWLGDRSTGAGGVWMLGGDSFDISPAALPNLPPSPFRDLRDVLKAVQVFGDDDDLDVCHRGTYVSHSLDRPSRVTEHYVFGGHIMLLTYRPFHHHCDPFITQLTQSLYQAFDNAWGGMTVVRSYSNHLDQNERSFFFLCEGEYGSGKEALFEDVEIIVESQPDQAPLGSFIQSQTEYTTPTLKQYAESTDVIGVVAERLQKLAGKLQVYHIINTPDDPYVNFCAASVGEVAVYHIKVKK